jgi:hypothetical protein
VATLMGYALFRRVLLIAFLCSNAGAEAAVQAVWAVHDGAGVERDDLDHPARRGNSVWNGTEISLIAARNEIVAFQVIVQSDADGIEALSVALPMLARQGGGGRIEHHAPGTDPTIGVNRAIQIFTVNYMHVTVESHADWVWENGGSGAPRDTTGWKPVQLVPENGRAGRGGFPLRVLPNQNQAIWMEVYTGRGRPAGTYAGTITVRADGDDRSLPISLEVLDFALPDRPSLPVMVYYEPDQPRRYQGADLDPAYHRFAHRHRVELVHGYTPEQLTRAAGRFDGSDFTAEHGYDGPGEGVGNRIAPGTFYGPGPFAAPDGWLRANRWVAALRRHAPGARSFVYPPDEPTPDRFPMVRRIAERLHANPDPGGQLPTFLTRRIEPALAGAVDIWCVPPQVLDLNAAAQERAAGREVWFYNHGRPNGPSLVIDAPPTDGRVIGWAAFKHNLDGYFYWHGVHWRHNSQKQGERNQDVWRNPVTFDNRGQPNKADFGFINGDGVLMYPGQEVLHPAEDRGLSGPIGTLQFANLRRGLQDYEYLTIARRLGLEREIDEALAAVVPRVFSDATAVVGFAENGDEFERMRSILGRGIVARARKMR